MAELTGEDRHALVALLPRLKRFCLMLTGSSADADDLLQATVERLLRGSLAKIQELDKWAFRVAKNAWIDEIRARKVRTAISVDDAGDHQMPSVDGVRAVEASLTMAQVQEAMRALPEDQRSVLVLVAIEGFAYKDAAEILDCPIGTVMSRLARARTALAAALDMDP